MLLHWRLLCRRALIYVLFFAEFSFTIGICFLPSEHKVRVEVQWPSVSSVQIAEDEEFEDFMYMTSADKARYKCTLPALHSNGKAETIQSYKGPSPLQLLKPIFSQLLCYFRLDTYWSYELCHGHYFRQFHEETTVRGRVLQEFFLGKYDSLALNTRDSNSKNQGSSPALKDLPTIRVDDAELPYFMLNMTGGSFCPITGNPRFTRVLYVCHPRGNNGIYSFKETSSCEYEVIVLTTVLCTHPAFRIDYFMESIVNCYPLPGFSPPKLTAEGEASVKPSENVADTNKPIRKTGKASSNVIEEQTPPTHDQKLIDDVLNGEYCLHGGSGWWRYEFCYGKKVRQYHESPGGRKTFILLGVWNVEKHLMWIEENPNKKLKPGTALNQISHFYDDGDFCEEVQKPRQLEVKLKCKEVVGHPNSVSLYFSEPRTCEYIITVESPIFCSLIEMADENGLTPNIRK